MNKDIKILVVEDDNDINKLLYEMLSNEGYTVKSAYSGTEALIYLEQHQWHMILLDLMLPGKSGEELLVHIRKDKKMPIIIISAKEEKGIKVEMLRSGADDFITKPFDIDEVLARIQSNLRRYVDFASKDNINKIITFEEISLNIDNRQVFVNNLEVLLTTREFDILELLIRNPKKVFSKANLFESVWDTEYMCDDNTITVHISNLRNKLAKCGVKQDYIQTVWGIGYKLS